jgi:hypothetical protein
LPGLLRAIPGASEAQEGGTANSPEGCVYDEQVAKGTGTKEGENLMPTNEQQWKDAEEKVSPPKQGKEDEGDEAQPAHVAIERKEPIGPKS